MQTRKLLILACGRSGTLYTSKVFRGVGLDLGHEKVGAYGTCSMYFVTPETNCATVNAHQKVPIHDGENRADYEFEHVWHQVRHPLAAIDSLAKAFTRKVRVWTGEQLHFHMPGRSAELRCPLEDRLRWAMRYWIENNKRCEEQSEWTYRVEDFPWVAMQARLCISPLYPLPVISTTTNRSLRYAFKTVVQTKDINEKMYDTTWSTLDALDAGLTLDIRILAASYGYPNR